MYPADIHLCIEGPEFMEKSINLLTEYRGGEGGGGGGGGGRDENSSRPSAKIRSNTFSGRPVSSSDGHLADQQYCSPIGQPNRGSFSM